MGMQKVSPEIHTQSLGSKMQQPYEYCPTWGAPDGQSSSDKTMTGGRGHQCEVAFLGQGCVRLANPVLLACLLHLMDTGWKGKKSREQVSGYYGVQ